MSHVWLHARLCTYINKGGGKGTRVIFYAALLIEYITCRYFLRSCDRRVKWLAGEKYTKPEFYASGQIVRVPKAAHFRGQGDAVNMRVTAQFGTKWYNATVLAAHQDGTYDLRFDDGIKKVRGYGCGGLTSNQHTRISPYNLCHLFFQCRTSTRETDTPGTFFCVLTMKSDNLSGSSFPPMLRSLTSLCPPPSSPPRRTRSSSL